MSENVQDAVLRVQRYLDGRKQLVGIDQEEIHTAGVNNEDYPWRQLLASDLVTILAEVTELREQLEARESAHSKESEDWTHLAAGYQHQIAEAQATIEKVASAVNGPHPANSGLDSFTLAHISAALSASSSTGGNDHDRAVVHEAAEAIRHHATAPTELVWPTVQIDRLLAWVADWIENPPEWVKVRTDREATDGPHDA